MPNMMGDEVLKLLKRDPQTRHIPVKILSFQDPELTLRRHGALAVLQKPLDFPSLQETVQKLVSYSGDLAPEVIVLEDDNALQLAMVEVMSSCLSTAKLTCFNRAKEALAHLNNHCPSVVVVDLGLPDMDGFEVIDHIHKLHCDIPIIVYTGRTLQPDQLKRLRQYADSVILKTTESLTRLVDEIGLFLHRSINNPQSCREKMGMFEPIDHNNLSDVEVLIVDDDVRNLFALQALLENSGMKVTSANHGIDALTLLKQHPEMRILLTDIMMPEMDGYELIRQVRSDPELAHLPIIALTAKVGTEEREKCIHAGADDYLTKPIDEAMLLALLRVWVNQSHL
jgi:CheY-like chemotaxis protein